MATKTIARPKAPAKPNDTNDAMMTEQQLNAYRMMYTALGFALDEIHNPGFNRTCGVDIVEHIEVLRRQAKLVALDAVDKSELRCGTKEEKPELKLVSKT